MQTQADTRWASRTRQSCLALILFAKLSASGPIHRAEILAIFPPRGPEGTRITMQWQKSDRPFPQFSSLTPRQSSARFLAERLIAIVPHKVTTSSITVITPQGRITSPLPFVVVNDPRIPDEVSYKAGYVKPVAASLQLQLRPAVGNCDRGHTSTESRIRQGGSHVGSPDLPHRW